MTIKFLGFASGAICSLCLVIGLGTVPSWVASATKAQERVSRQQLIGTWQLLSIQVIGKGGRANDPFYNADPTGMLVYDASGWMSVQIAGSSRPAMDTHASRPGAPHNLENARLEAAVLDSYYAYAAEWELDAAASKVTHHVRLSLIPGEIGKSYTQAVHLDGDRLIFTTQRDDLGAGTIQEKVWKKMPARTD